MIIHHNDRCEPGACVSACAVLAASRTRRKLVRVGPRSFEVTETARLDADRTATGKTIEKEPER